MLRPCEYREGTYLERLPNEIQYEIVRYIWMYNVKVERSSSAIITMALFPDIGFQSCVFFYSSHVSSTSVLTFVQDVEFSESKRLREGTGACVHWISVGVDCTLTYEAGLIHYNRNADVNLRVSSFVVSTAVVNGLRRVAELLRE